MSDVTADVEQLSYEQAFSEIEEIVSRIEEDTLTLEESLSLYERGKALINRCSTLLDRAELKVRQLSDLEDGKFPLDENGISSGDEK